MIPRIAHIGLYTMHGIGLRNALCLLSSVFLVAFVVESVFVIDPTNQKTTLRTATLVLFHCIKVAPLRGPA